MPVLAGGFVVDQSLARAIRGAGAAPGPQPPTVQYIDPDGVVWPWYDLAEGYQITALTGFGSPPVGLIAQSLPAGGSLALDVRPDVAAPVVQLYIEADDQASYLARVRALRRGLTHRRAAAGVSYLQPGTLDVGWPDGTRRLLDVYCVDGMPRTDASAENEGLTYGIFTLQFSAPDPFWRDSNETHIPFGLVGAGVSGIPPLLPINLGASTVLGRQTITVLGDAPAWPRWQIQGPGLPTLVNHTTGETFAFSTLLGGTETLTIDATPTAQTVVDGTGANRWPDVATVPSPSLWALQPGDNDVEITMGSSGTGTSIDLYYTPRWLGA